MGPGPATSRAATTARDWLDAALAVILAPACAACDAVLEAPSLGPVCGRCWAAIPPAPLVWRPATPSIELIASAASYDGSLRDIIRAWKFGHRQALSRPLGRLVRERTGVALKEADLLVPVPMLPLRRWQRGFNQSEDLAAALGAPRARALARWRPGAPQSSLSAAARMANPAGSIFVLPWRRAAVRGKRVVLVDDVVTTGATLEACARALLGAGAVEVRAVTVARTLRLAPSARPPQAAR